MRIISRFHDYYDVVMRSGQDQELLYLRHSSEEKIPNEKFPVCKATTQRVSWSAPSLRLTDYIIGFCGKIYAAIQVSHWSFAQGKEITAICYSIEDLDNFVQQNFKKKQIAEYFKPEKTSWRTRHWNFYCQRQIFVNFFNEVKQKEDSFKEFFIEKNCPIFIIERNARDGNRQLITNACLKNLEFFRIMDPFRTFQELQMYLGGLASPEKKIPEISNEDLIQAKGFDKWSFRKPPSK